MSSSSQAGLETESDPVREFETKSGKTARRKSGLATARLRRIRESMGSRYEALLNNLGIHRETDWPQMIALTSCKPGEGVSTLAAQLAICATRLPINVLLIDCNCRNPSLHIPFRIKAKSGLCDSLQNGNIHDAVYRTNISNLSIIPFGSGVDITTPVVEFEDALQELQIEFDLVVLDLPAVSAGPQAIRWAPICKHLLLVVSRSTSTQTAANAKRLLESAGANLTGIVQNLH